MSHESTAAATACGRQRPHGKSTVGRRIEKKHVQRLQTVLQRARGKGTGEIADFLGMQRTVRLYIKRYNNFSVDSLLRDKTCKPGKKPVSQETKNKICRIACNEKPENETHWSTRTLAKRVGISHTAVNQILRECWLKPHRVSRRNYSADSDFEAKPTDVVGLYVKPPENSIELCVDEKTQIQALECSQPILPMLRNVPERQTVKHAAWNHDPVRRVGRTERERNRGLQEAAHACRVLV